MSWRKLENPEEPMQAPVERAKGLQFQTQNLSDVRRQG